MLTWEASKGYGWLDWAGKRIFLHAKDYRGSRCGLVVGEEIRFVLGVDAKGRPCAKAARPARADVGKGLAVHWVGVMVLLALPTYAVLNPHHHSQMPAQVGVAAVWTLVISMVTYATYASDKRRAATNAWRVPEVNLHLLELMGGWPGAWIAQGRLRHKCSKPGYQATFWTIILIHQFVAYDSLSGFPLCRLLIQMTSR